MLEDFIGANRDTVIARNRDRVAARPSPVTRALRLAKFTGAVDHERVV